MFVLFSWCWFVVLVWCGVVWFCCGVVWCGVAQSWIHSTHHTVSSHCQHTVANADNSQLPSLSLVLSLVEAGSSDQLMVLKVNMEPVTEQVLSLCLLIL